MNFKYFQSSNESLFSKRLLSSLMADIMFKQASFRGFCDSYKYLNAKDVEIRFKLNMKRLIEVFYCFEIIKFFIENNKPLLKCKYQLISNFTKIIDNKFF